MRTTKKILSVVLACCMLTSTAAVSTLAATVDNNAVSAGSNALDNKYTQAVEALDAQYRYDGKDLGATYTPGKTTFKVWAPTATKITLNLYATGSDSEEGAADLGTHEMKYDDKTGVWTVEVKGDLKNVYYTYTITAKSATSTAVTTKETQDVYSKAVGVNGERSMVVDLDSTDPEGWDQDKHVLPDVVTDSTVWEIHVKDFSHDPASGVSEANRGKFLAFTETGTTLNGEGDLSTGIDYLKELGITTVQINPFYDFQSVNEAGDLDAQFNWGYDPMNYNVPEGSYSTNPYDGNVRIKECKEMIQALHDAGISVVMDVVYNHTFTTDSCFQATVPNYYYRLNASGTFSNGSGCGNECATERAMYRNYLIDSCMYWVNEYHVDGFRFDLMGIMDVEAMNQVRAALDTVDPKITTWGEGWSGGDSYHPTNTCDGTTFYPAIQANVSMLDERIALFNDAIRDGVKGGAMSIANYGYVQGSKSSVQNILYGIRANTVGNFKWVPKTPSQCVTYVDCHDNATLYDQLVASTASGDYGVRYEELVKMNKLAAAIVNTSQGVSFMHAGQEMARTKFGDTNSYKSSAEINKINWQNIVDYADLVSYYKGMLDIRASFTPFTTPGKDYAAKYTVSNSFSSYAYDISFTIDNDQPNEWKKMAVIYNSNTLPMDVKVKGAAAEDQWVIIANHESAGFDNLGEVTGSTFTVAPRSALIAVDKASFDALSMDDGMGRVKVNYVYEKTGEKFEDSIVLTGSYGTKYETVPCPGIPDTYVVNKVEGNEKGTFAKADAEVTYYYTDYVPASFKNADLNADGKVDVMDVTVLQLHLVGETDVKASADVNCDVNVDVKDVTALQMYLAGYVVSSNSVTVNHYYTDANGELKTITKSTTINGKVGDAYTTEAYRIVGYAVDPEKTPANANGFIPYGETVEVNYYYIPSSLDIKLHVKHDDNLTWAPTVWLWGSDAAGKDSYNFTKSGTWPGDKLADADGDGWFDTDFTYKGVGSYNVIVSNGGNYQTIDYKGFVDNELWIVIDDSETSGNTYLKFYSENPDTNPDAPEAKPIV